MIQCPICQVLNEDGALFCAECGQRFNQASQPSQPAAAPPPPAQSAPPQVPQMPSPPQPQEIPSQETTDNRPRGIKLRSPMLGGGEDDADQGHEQLNLGKLRGTGQQKQSSTGRKHLRSPLLGDSDDDDDDVEDSRSGRNARSSEPTGDYGPGAPRKKKLRSPLLGEDDDDDGQDFTPDGPARGKRPLRSPLLGEGGADEGPARPRKPARGPEEHHGQPHKRGLHSPLLGGDDFDDYDDDELPSRDVPKKGPTGKPKLRSSLLGGGGYDDDYDDDWDDEEDDNPNVLRSPLLAAKKKRPKPEAAPAAGVFGAGQDLPPGVQVHRQEVQAPSKSAPAPDVRNWSEQNAQSGQHQPFQQQAPVAAVEAPAPALAPVGAPPPFPGPSEPQPPWQQAPAPPGWVQGAAQPQPGQPWPPAPTLQEIPLPGQPAAEPPLPAETSTQAPPWQNRMSEPLPSMLDRPQQDVPPIVDNNDEFDLDLLDGAPGSSAMGTASAAPPAPPPSALEGPPLRGRPPADFGKPKTEEEQKDTLVDEDGPNERRRLERRRGGSDRRLSSLLDDRPSSAPPPISDDEDDFMAPRSKAGAGNPMAKMMFGVGALALGFKIWFFIHVAGLWDLSKMPDFIAEQMFSGLALVGLIVFTLSSMKK